MKSFGSGKYVCGKSSTKTRLSSVDGDNNELPKDHPVLVNTDYEKRLREFDKAFDHLTREIERRDELIRNLLKDETTSTSIDVSLIRQIINEEIKESTGAMSPKSERIDRSNEVRRGEEERKRESVDEEFVQQNDSLAKISNDVTLFEEILKNKMNASQRETAYLKTTKAMECRINEAKKKNRESVDRGH